MNKYRITTCRACGWQVAGREWGNGSGWHLVSEEYRCDHNVFANPQIDVAPQGEIISWNEKHEL